MKVTIGKNQKKEEKGWDKVKLVEWTDGKGVNNMIVLTNGKHEGDENGTFEGTVLYNSDEHSIHKVGNSVKDWMKISFKEVEQLTLTFVS